MKFKVITDDHHDLSDGKINNISKEYPCISCHTNCCKEYTIFVNTHDIYRLSINLGLEPERFLDIHGAKDYSLGIGKGRSSGSCFKTKKWRMRVFRRISRCFSMHSK